MTLKTMYWETKDQVARLTLNRPEVLNAADVQWVEDLNTALDTIAPDDKLKVLVVTGAGRAFCTGIDLTVLAEGLIVNDWFRRWERAMRLFETMDKVVIAAINGHCLGGGLQVALACDIRFSVDTATFGLPAVKECLIPGLGTYRLPRTIGMGRAKDLILSGDVIDAHRAKEIGLVDYVVPASQFEPELARLTDKFLRAATASARLCKQLTNEAFDTDYETFLNDYLKAQAMAMASEDHKAAMERWKEERKHNRPS